MASEIKNYYDELASTYDENRFGNSYGKYIDAQERSILNKIFKSKNFKTVLDLGCGTGRLLNFASHGVDFSDEMLNVAQKKFPNTILKKGELKSIPFNDNFFDCIFSFHVIMHQNEHSVKEFLDETHQKLNEKGTLIFDYISSKRRKEKSQQNEWHANNSFSEQKIKELIGERWKIKNTYGVLFFPIHRFSDGFRKFLLPIDSFLCRTFLKKWASYTILVLEKNKN